MPENKLPSDIAGFSANCRSSIQGESGGSLTMDALAHRLLELNPKAVSGWIERIVTVDRATIEEIFDRMPESWVSDVRAQFAIYFLDASRDRLVMLATNQQEVKANLQAPAEEELNPKQIYLKELTRSNSEKSPLSKPKNPYHQQLNESLDARVTIDDEDGDSPSNRDDLSL